MSNIRKATVEELAATDSSSVTRYPFAKLGVGDAWEFGTEHLRSRVDNAARGYAARHGVRFRIVRAGDGRHALIRVK